MTVSGMNSFAGMTIGSVSVIPYERTPKSIVQSWTTVGWGGEKAEATEADATNNAGPIRNTYGRLVASFRVGQNCVDKIDESGFLRSMRATFAPQVIPYPPQHEMDLSPPPDPADDANLRR
jgi:hypothetical protein